MNIFITVRNDFMSEPSVLRSNNIIVVLKKNYIKYNARKKIESYRESPGESSCRKEDLSLVFIIGRRHIQ
jgi:hypothetical protein